jgi:mRNA interferase RelE/StbE
LDVISRLIRIYVTDRNSEENKLFRLDLHEDFRHFGAEMWLILKSSIIENFTREGRDQNRIYKENYKKLVESNRWILPDARRRFKLNAIAPPELLTTHPDESSQIENLQVDLNEVICEDSIYTIEDYYRALWRNVEKTEQSEIDRIHYCQARYIAKAPDEGHYSLLLTKDFSKSLRSISKEYQERVLSAISEISANPFFAHGNAVKPLSHQEGNIWRKRVGDYRIVYSPARKENTVMLLKVGHRSSVYRGY